MILETCHEPLCILYAALCQPQLGQPGEGLRADWRHGITREIQGCPQLHLGPVPFSGEEQDSSVVGPAGGIQERAAVSFDEPVRRPNPLHDPLEVRTAITRVDHLAADEDHGVELALACERAGHRLVDKGHTIVDVATFYVDGPDLAQGAQLEVPVPKLDGQAPCLVGQVPALVGIRAASGLEEQHPAPHGLEVELTYQPRGVSRPPGRGGVVTEVGLVDETELKGHVGRLDRVDGTERGVSLLPPTHRLPDFSQPPQRVSQSQQYLGGLLRPISRT